MDEAERIKRRYERRRLVAADDRYSFLNPAVIDRVQERQRVMLGLLAAHGAHPLSTQRILEVGCGGGNNLVELILFGARPANLAGNDILPEHVDFCRERLPPAVDLRTGNAAELDYADASFDIVLQSTVFTSILDPELQERVAGAMWRWLKPGGAVVWYDFVYDNPANRDVRGVSLRRVRQLFPHGLTTTRRVSLAPPIARRVPAWLYGPLNALPFLRTHLLCLIAKPR